MQWRGFGNLHDLDLDFHEVSRSAAVTDLLVRCRNDEHDADARAAEARHLTLAGRIGALALIVTRTTGAAELALVLRCPECAESLQIDLPIATLLELARRAEKEPLLEVNLPDAGMIQVRRPTGEHQRQWQTQRYSSARAAQLAIVDTLVEDKHKTMARAQVDIISDALDEADPLPAFKLATICHACEMESEHAVDLEALLLAELQKVQRTLLHEVDRLAERYGWSEAAILALPHWRRRAYLAITGDAR
jgi:hypothetical protein